MKNIKTAILAISLLFASLSIKSQEELTIKNPPIFIEAFTGNRGFGYQMLINKKIQSVPKFGFFSFTSLQSEWGESLMNDYIVQGNLTYNIIKGIDLSSGFNWNPIDGIRPSAGVLLSYGNPNLLSIVNPRIDLTKNPNFDVFGMVEYKPNINERIELYTRLQGLYSRNLGHDIHARSYIMLRAGLTFKDITLGVASNLDWYGPLKQNESNFGGFIALNLF